MRRVAILFGAVLGLLPCVVTAARAAPPTDVDWPRVSVPSSVIHRMAAVGTVEEGASTTEKFDLPFERAKSVSAPAAGEATPAIDLTQGRAWGTSTSVTPDGEQFRRVFESAAELTGSGFNYLSQGQPGVRRRWSEVGPKLLTKPVEGNSVGDLEDLTTIVLVPPERSTPILVGADWTTPRIGGGTNAEFRHVVSAIDAGAISIRTSPVHTAPAATFALVRRMSRRDGFVIDGTLRCRWRPGNACAGRTCPHGDTRRDGECRTLETPTASNHPISAYPVWCGKTEI
jgi:hypothetical protein